jgi:hypothetical protein
MSKSETTMRRAEWIAAYSAAFCRIAVERGIWTAEDALPWAESVQNDAWACAGDCPPAEVAAEDVDMCRKESAP